METPVVHTSAEQSAPTTSSASVTQSLTASAGPIEGGVVAPIVPVVAKSNKPAKAAKAMKVKAKTEKKQRVAAKVKRVAKVASPKKQVAKSKKLKKSDIVRALLADKANRKLPRKELLALIARKANLSAAAANTYRYNYASA